MKRLKTLLMASATTLALSAQNVIPAIVKNVITTDPELGQYAEDILYGNAQKLFSKRQQ